MGTTRPGSDTSSPSTVDAAIEATRRLRREVGAMTFKPPVAHVYNPLDYAWAVHALYLKPVPAKRLRILDDALRLCAFALNGCVGGIPNS